MQVVIEFQSNEFHCEFLFKIDGEYIFTTFSADVTVSALESLGVDKVGFTTPGQAMVLEKIYPFHMRDAFSLAEERFAIPAVRLVNSCLVFHQDVGQVPERFLDARAIAEACLPKRFQK